MLQLVCDIRANNTRRTLLQTKISFDHVEPIVIYTLAHCLLVIFTSEALFQAGNLQRSSVAPWLMYCPLIC